MSGRPIWMVRMSVVKEKEDEFNDWYNNIHIPEQLKIPGIVSAKRYLKVTPPSKYVVHTLDEPDYLAMYELEDEAAIELFLNGDGLKNATKDRARWDPFIKASKRNMYKLILP